MRIIKRFADFIGESENNRPKDQKKVITVTCRDTENSLEELLKYIQQNGNGGHSFSIIVDPEGDKDQKKTFGWDGDGSDRIFDISSEMVDEDEKDEEDEDEKLEESRSSIEHDIEYYKELVSDDKKRLKNASGGEAEMILQNLAYNQKMLSSARRQLKLEESEKGVDLRDDKSCKCKGCGNPVKEGMLLCEKCEDRGFYIAPNGKVISPEEDVKEHLELTTAEIKKMVDDSKDMTPEEQRKIALSLPMTACALYVLEMKKRHNKKVSI
jgi:hypothetical protein